MDDEDEAREDYAIIAYWDDDKTVQYFAYGEGVPAYPQFGTIYGALERYLCHAQCTEILEVIHGTDINKRANAAADRWKVHLTNLGYEIVN